MIRSFAVILALAALSFGSADATEYFVSKQGSDNNAGTSRQEAFLTVQKGVDALDPGDTLTIGSGEYFENIRRDNLGGDEARTAIRAEIPGTAVLRGDVPAPSFRRFEGTKFVYVADFDADGQATAVNEIDTLAILQSMPNAAELEFSPGSFHHDPAEGKLYLSTSDMQPADTHRYSVSLIPTHGIYLREPRRVTIEGLGVTGYNALKEAPNRERTHEGIWGVFLLNARDCVVRDCRAWLNGWGIAVRSEASNTGDNVIERCVAWANTSQFKSGDMGGLTIFSGRRDTIRNSVAFLNGMYGINIYGTGTDGGGAYGDANVIGNDDANKSMLTDNLAWGNWCDFKIKTGVSYFHRSERNVGLGLWSIRSNIEHCLMPTGQDRPRDTIVLDAEADLDPQLEFADPDNHDFRLQATSRFRGAGPDGGDRGPFPYKDNIYFVRTDGDDDADGLSVANAWRTLARATRSLKAGDTLYLEPGVYPGALTLSAQGEEGARVSVRGRGSDPVAVQGGLRVEGSRHAEVQRVRFADSANISNSSAIHVENCRFDTDGTALQATDVKGLAVVHTVFAGFREAAVSLRDCSGAVLKGNLYDNQSGAAVRVDRAEAIRYSNYNSYRNAARAWQMGEASHSLANLPDRHDQKSLELTPRFAGGGSADLQNPEAFAGAGPLGKAIGNHRDVARTEELAVTHGPVVHSVSATTANIEWMTTLPAVCGLAWGETPACENTTSFEVNKYGSYSLTGLKPGQTYYFRIESLKVPDGLLPPIEAAPVALEGDPISFATLGANRRPAVYYVAPDGDNANSGRDRANAWRTIQHAASQVNPGDTVRVAGGTYHERVRIRATGESGAPISFEAMPGEKAVIDGAEKALNTGFVGAAKSHLRFDGFYLREFSFFPSQGWRILRSGEFHFYKGRDIQITRCFSDGRAGYTARFVSAWDIEDLLIKNCVTTRKMSGAVQLVHCPNLRIENSVLVRPLTGSFALSNSDGEKATLANSIFTDMLQKKAALNVPLFYTSTFDGLQMPNNCLYIRSFPPEERNLFGRGATLEHVRDYLIEPVFADPRFAGDPTDETQFGPDQMMNASFDLDFNSFFATNPEIVERGIGLQPEAFDDFHFNAPAE